MSAHEIIRIANELAAKGLTPTTAMIKARLTQPVPMAELLKVLSQWKQQPVATAESEILQEAAPSLHRSSPCSNSPNSSRASNRRWIA